jgi:hypothetical protein
MAPETRIPVSAEEFWHLAHRLHHHLTARALGIAVSEAGFILSRDPPTAKVATKVADFLTAGAQAVWVVDPDARTVAVRTRAGVMVFSTDEVLRGAPPPPEFDLPLADLFAEID